MRRRAYTNEDLEPELILEHPGSFIIYDKGLIRYLMESAGYLSLGFSVKNVREKHDATPSLDQRPSQS